MIKVMIVDDELPIINGLKSIIRKDLSEVYEVVATASSGREAIQLFTETSPSVVLMDIMMPGLSGLEALREIRRLDKNAVFLLITAYERFDIAREAVSLQVFEYLVKPIERNKVVAALQRVVMKVVGDSSSFNTQLRLREQNDTIKNLQAKVLSYAIMTGEDLSDSLPKHLELLDICSDKVAIGALLLKTQKAQQGYRAWIQALQYKSKALSGPLVGGRTLILLPVETGDRIEDEKALIEELLKTTFGHLLENAEVRIGWAPEHVAWETAHAGWCEALLHAQGKGAKDHETTRAEAEKMWQLDEKLGKGTLSNQPDALRAALEKDALIWRSLGTVQPWGRFRWVLLLGNLYQQLVLEGTIQASTAIALMDFSDMTEEIPPEEWTKRVEARLEPILEKLQNRQRYSSHVVRAIEKVAENFFKPITLDSVADDIGISPGRLSRLFVLETGKGFSEYVIDHRLALACKLLGQPGASVKSVSMSVGYPDPNYFTRLFRKKLKLTPSSFQNNLKKEDNAE